MKPTVRKKRLKIGNIAISMRIVSKNEKKNQIFGKISVSLWKQISSLLEHSTRLSGQNLVKYGEASIFHESKI